MKKLELKFGTPLTKEQMRKINGGDGSCDICDANGVLYNQVCYFDIFDCAAALNAALNSGTISYYSCTDGETGGIFDCNTIE